jgi:hypothetical protein
MLILFFEPLNFVFLHFQLDLLYPIVLVQCYALTTLWMVEISSLNLVSYCRPDRPIDQLLLGGDVFLNSGTMVMPLEVLKCASHSLLLAPFSRTSHFCSLPAACCSFLRNKLTRKSRK